jgi:MFS family permease
MQAAERTMEGEAAGAPSLWREGAFRAIWAGQTASLFGDQVTGLALPWLILLQTHSALAAGIVAAARYVPLVTLGLAAGVVADRVDRRTLLVASDTGRALTLGVVALLGVRRLAPPLWLLALVMMALGTGQLLFQVAYQAWLPDVTGEARLGRANAAMEASDAVSVLAGYPLAGLVIGWVGPVLALGADALSYVGSALSLLVANGPTAHTAHTTQSERAGRAKAQGRPGGGVRAGAEEALAGVRTIVATPAQRVLKGAGAALYLDAGAIGVLVATLTQLRLHLPAWQAGLVFGAMGVGGLVGSALGGRVLAWGWKRGLALALAVMAIGSLGLAWACLLGPRSGFAVALVADAVLDGAAALGFILVGTATTLVTPRELRGRVNAAGALYSSAVRAVAAVGGGALAATGNPLPAFALLAVCCGGGALMTARARVSAD